MRGEGTGPPSAVAGRLLGMIKGNGVYIMSKLSGREAAEPQSVKLTVLLTVWVSHTSEFPFKRKFLRVKR